MRSKPVILFLIVLTVIATVSASALIYYRKSDARARSASAKSIAEKRWRQILTELNFAKKRLAFFNLDGAAENSAAVLFSMAENAILLQDAEALETIARRLETLTPKDKTDDRARVENLKKKASEFYSVRARSRRYELHQINTRLERLPATAVETDETAERGWLEKTRAVLLEEYPKDAERAVELDGENFRAIYDLTRFLQDKTGGYDKRVVIRNFEKVVALGNGRFEKDADYLRANLNLTVLYYQIGDWARAKCYSSQTMEKYLARGADDYEYLFSKTADGNWEEPEFIEAVEKVNPNRETAHEICGEIRPGN